MKKSLLFVVITLMSFSMYAQNSLEQPEMNLSQNEVEAHLRFLASDELQGRRTGSPGNDIAARYIAEKLREYGVQEVPGHGSYFQDVPFAAVTPASEGYLKFGDHTFTLGEDLVLLSGAKSEVEGAGVFAGHGLEDDYEGLNVEGKIVFTISGLPGEFSPMETFGSMSTKRAIAAEKGAIGLVELHKIPIPWPFFKRYFGKERIRLSDGGEQQGAGDQIPYGWVNEGETGLLAALNAKKSKQKYTFATSGSKKRVISSRNVVGVIEGTDPVLKEEYIILTAHFDHVGVGKEGGGAYTPEDSIFNGARDNAFGTSALLSAAKSIAASPTRRSVIIVGFTGEELGLLGSKYYADNPLIPLNKTVGNLNTDGGGYNDTSKVVFLGYSRVDMKIDIESACSQFGLTVIDDPVPEQNLFERSDNASLAKKGVPAPAFSPGLTVFDKEIMKYYHQVADNPDTIDMAYLLRYCKAFTATCRLLGNASERPEWLPGDKYEEAAKNLYSTK